MPHTPLFDPSLRTWAPSWRGRVVEVHPNAALVRAGDTLLTLARATHPLVPDGVVLPPGAPLPARGEAVTLDADRLHAGDAATIELLGPGMDLRVIATTATVRIPAGLPLPPRTRAILGEPTADAPRPASPELRALHDRLRRLVRATPPATPAAVAALVGLGAGSTPAGDDLLLGALAARLRLDADPEPLADALGQIPPGRTTPVARAMLALGARGRVLRPLLELIHTLGTPRRWPISALLAVGGSSGGDMLAGVLAAIDAALENR